MKKILITTAICASLLLSSATTVYAAPVNPWQTFIERLLNFFKPKPKPIPPPPPVPVPSTTTLHPTANYMADYGVTAPKENNYFWRTADRQDTPSYFVEFDKQKLNTNQPLYLTTTWTYLDAPIQTTTQTDKITNFTTNNGVFGTWAAPSNINWGPEPWDGELYHWNVTAVWSNAQTVTWKNLLPQWGNLGMAISRLFTPANQLTTLGGVGTSTMKFTTNPEPVSSFLFLTGGALLAARYRKRRK